MKKYILIAFLFINSALATPPADGNYYCTDLEDVGINYRITVSTVSNEKLISLTHIESKGGYVCTWYCDDMGISDLPYTMTYLGTRIFDEGPITDYGNIKDGVLRQAMFTTFTGYLRGTFGYRNVIDGAGTANECVLIR